MNKEMVIQLLENLVYEKELLIKNISKHKRMHNDEKSVAASKYRLDQLALAHAIAALKHKEGE